MPPLRFINAVRRANDRGMQQKLKYGRETLYAEIAIAATC